MKSRTRPGDFLRVCDQSGFAVPASRTRKQWDNLIVDRKYFDEKHPQLTIRARRDDFSIQDPRPRPVDLNVGSLTTTVATAANAGVTNIEVDTSARFAAGDNITIVLASKDIFRAVVASVPSATHLALTVGLPGAVEANAMIVNYSAVAPADYGQ